VRPASYITAPHLVSDPLLARRFDATKIVSWVRAWALAVVVSGCGPPLSDPSPVNLTGTWTSADHLGTLSNLEVIINQAPDGALSGTWSSDVSPPHPPCPPDVSDRATGTMSGSNTVVAVQFSLLGAGDFEGQVIDSAHIRGSLISCSSILAISLLRAGPVPSG
jgi:hypothetical protein